MMTSLNSPIGSAGMSVTWPKAQGTPLAALRGSQQISADSSAVVGKGKCVCVCVCVFVCELVCVCVCVCLCVS